MNGRRLKYRTCWLSLLIALLVTADARAVPQSQPQSQTKKAAPHIVLRPRLVSGEVMRYQIEFQTTSETTRGGIVRDAQASQLVVTWDALVRLEVMGEAAETGAAATPGSGPRAAVSARTGASPKPASARGIRLRTTYEKSVATVKSDTPDPEEENIEAAYAHLEGLSIVFTLGSDGHVSDVRGLGRHRFQRANLESRRAMDGAAIWRRFAAGHGHSSGAEVDFGADGNLLAARGGWLGAPIPRICGTNRAARQVPPATRRSLARTRAANRAPDPHAAYACVTPPCARPHAGGVSPQRIAHGRALDGHRAKPQLYLAAKRLGGQRHARRHRADGRHH